MADSYLSEEEQKALELAGRIREKHWSWREPETRYGPYFVDLGDEWADSGEEFVEENGISEDWAEIYATVDGEAHAQFIAHADPSFILFVLTRLENALKENEEAWWRAGAGFRWCWPRFCVYIPADQRRMQVSLNRYPHNVIGAEVCIFGRCWGVQWKCS